MENMARLPDVLMKEVLSYLNLRSVNEELRKDVEGLSTMTELMGDKIDDQRIRIEFLEDELDDSDRLRMELRGLRDTLTLYRARMFYE